WELLDGTMDFDFDLLPKNFDDSFDREYAEKLVAEAFEEDTGLEVGSGVAENHKEEDQDQPGLGVGRDGELGKADDKEDREGGREEEDYNTN
ncbi:hypothetical protein THAOC_22881, partial [Thalassiosira oceanica]